MTAQILFVDDEPAIRRLVRGAVERFGLTVAEAANATEALTLARREGCELVLLDLGLPDRDGIELVSLMKAMDRAVIDLTARDVTAEKVAALDLGADDYVVKPFDKDELLARIRTAMRHQMPNSSTSGEITSGVLTIDVLVHRVQKQKLEIRLTRREFAVLLERARHPGRVVTHTHLLRNVWGEAHIGDIEYLRVAVRGLRLKIENDPANPIFIQNEPGVGYRLIESA